MMKALLSNVNDNIIRNDMIFNLCRIIDVNDEKLPWHFLSEIHIACGSKLIDLQRF